jgi:hypothetical protein
MVLSQVSIYVARAVGSINFELTKKITRVARDGSHVFLFFRNILWLIEKIFWAIE